MWPRKSTYFSKELKEDNFPFSSSTPAVSSLSPTLCVSLLFSEIPLPPRHAVVCPPSYLKQRRFFFFSPSSLGSCWDLQLASLGFIKNVLMYCLSPFLNSFVSETNNSKRGPLISLASSGDPDGTPQIPVTISEASWVVCFYVVAMALTNLK